jgi:ketosteroid isomerase-like protein
MLRMGSRIRIGAAALVLLPCWAWSESGEDLASLTAEVNAIFAEWAETVSNLDLEGFVSLWDEHCVKLADHAPVLRGADALRAEFSGPFGAGDRGEWTQFTIIVEEVVSAGSFVWAMGTYDLSWQFYDQVDPMVNLGTYLTVFRRQQDGSLRVYRDTMMDGTWEFAPHLDDIVQVIPVVPGATQLSP